MPPERGNAAQSQSFFRTTPSALQVPAFFFPCFVFYQSTKEKKKKSTLPLASSGVCSVGFGDARKKIPRMKGLR